MSFAVLKKKIKEELTAGHWNDGRVSGYERVLYLIEELEKEKPIQLHSLECDCWSGRSAKEIRERTAFVQEKDREFKRSGTTEFSKEYSDGFKDGAVCYLEWVLSSEKKDFNPDCDDCLTMEGPCGNCKRVSSEKKEKLTGGDECEQCCCNDCCNKEENGKVCDCPHHAVSSAPKEKYIRLFCPKHGPMMEVKESYLLDLQKRGEHFVPDCMGCRVDGFRNSEVFEK